jgi:hypothetical protein
MYHPTVRHLNAAAFPGDEKRNILKGTDKYAPVKKHRIQIEFLDREAGSYPRLEVSGPKERRISTPRSDLLVVKIGRPKSKEAVSVREKASALVAGLVKATRKPGTSRERIFNSSVGKRVFAYSVYAGDTTKIVREDASGKRSVGRLVNGRFRSLPARTP